ncbi:hypothetical protein BU24DRAFT_409286 [Aaosphaeria arxii CBS 175.79]|uniref:Uncharacterized protein n=1 Tax=Aaosphaeria arxii CBS 175.79 TaxID=1450172 RepID=A0A6A5XS58_9PLEO|nr:uncharacterized protein BU24DRAFT_409286 [Aaosphaeria arxii CBS 175.79]KAF2016138.1 hypothetical protein BU24DRAFT_409286 [Aaosphaeria arxii CBS 175.79]
MHLVNAIPLQPSPVYLAVTWQSRLSDQCLIDSRSATWIITRPNAETRDRDSRFAADLWLRIKLLSSWETFLVIASLSIEHTGGMDIESASQETERAAPGESPAHGTTTMLIPLRSQGRDKA